MEGMIYECDIPFASEVVIKEETPEPSQRYVMKTMVLICVCVIMCSKFTQDRNI